MSTKCPKCKTKIFGDKQEGEIFFCATGCQTRLTMKKVKIGDGIFDIELRAVELK